jgi:hypothetical protein
VEEDDGRAAAFLDVGHLLPVDFSEPFGLFLCRKHASLLYIFKASFAVCQAKALILSRKASGSDPFPTIVSSTATTAHAGLRANAFGRFSRVVSGPAALGP